MSPFRGLGLCLLELYYNNFIPSGFGYVVVNKLLEEFQKITPKG